MRIASLVLVILLAFTFSCGGIWVEGNKFDASKRDQIVKNKTTAQELEALMGKPYKVEKKEAGKEKYIYYYNHEEYLRWNVLPKSTMQKLDVDLMNGVVTEYTYTRSNTDPIKD
jgi:hypothetical protein